MKSRFFFAADAGGSQHNARSSIVSLPTGPLRRGKGIVTNSTRLTWLTAAISVLAVSSAAADCIDPSELSRSTTIMSRMFEDSTTARFVAGTGWFSSASTIVAAAHVAEGLSLSHTDWVTVKLGNAEIKTGVDVRIARWVDALPEKIAILKLRRTVREAMPLTIRSQPLEADERVLSIAYSGLKLRFANGRFVRNETESDLNGAALFEIYDGMDRLAIDEGASGAPVVDCHGKVVGVVTGTLTQTVSMFSGTVRISTAWQKPNVVGIPVHRLASLKISAR